MSRRLPWIGTGLALTLALGGAGITTTAWDPGPQNAYGILGAPKLRKAYQEWVRAHEARGADRHVRVGLGYNKGLSRAFTRASGSAELDLVGGEVRAELQGLPPGEFELWIVDNANGSSVRPEAGDLKLRVGALERTADRAQLRAQLNPRTFTQLSVDLVVVAPAGAGPAHGLLYGSLPLFQRLYTALRSPTLLAASEFEPKSLQRGLGVALAQSADVLVDPDVVLELAIERGAELFINGRFNGNGRTCATCHPFGANTQLSVADIAALPDSDPLFLAERPGPLLFTPGGPKFEVPVLMRQAGLIMENQDGFDDTANRFNLRSIPHTLALGTSLAPLVGNSDLGPTGPFPLDRTGWSADGAPGDGALRDFATGAVMQHFPRTLARIDGSDFRLPNDGELNDMEAFQRALGRDGPITANLATMPLLGAQALAGRDLFVAAATRCNGCHNNAGATNAAGVNRNFNTGIELRPGRPTEQILIAEGIDLTPAILGNLVPRDGGFGAIGNPTAAPPGSGTGNEVDGFGNGSFNTPPLVEAADTAPFFHDNSAATLEDAIRFYTTPTFAASPAGGGNAVVLSNTQVSSLSALLRVLNALENIRAARDIAQAVSQLPPNRRNALGRPLLRQAREEVEDARRVLTTLPSSPVLHPAAVAQLDEALDFLSRPNPPTNPNQMGDLIDQLDAARGDMLAS
jgi:cytochrome c553